MYKDKKVEEALVTRHPLSSPILRKLGYYTVSLGGSTVGLNFAFGGPEYIFWAGAGVEIAGVITSAVYAVNALANHVRQIVMSNDERHELLATHAVQAQEVMESSV